MKKTILVTLVAAMILFAFTACDNSAAYPVYRNVAYISIDQTGDFVKGQVFDASKFTVNATYTDGTTSEVPAVVKGDSWDSTAAKTEVTATLDVLLADGTTGKVTTTLPVTLYDWKSVSVTGFSAEVATNGTNNFDDFRPAINDGTASVSVAYANGSVTLSAADVANITVSWDPADSTLDPSDLEEGDTVALKIDEVKVNGTAIATSVASDLVATIVPASGPATKADVTELVVTYDNVVKYGATFVEPTVVGKTASGAEVKLTKTTDYVFGNGIPTGNISSLDPISFTVYFVVGDSGNKNTVAPVTCNYTVADQINTTSLSLKYAGTVYTNEVTKIDTNLISAEATYQGNTNAKETSFTFFIDGSPELKPTSTSAVSIDVDWTCVPTGQTGTAKLSITPQTKPE